MISQYYIPPVAQSNEETLIAPFLFKFTSVNAGLGWIGNLKTHHRKHSCGLCMVACPIGI